VLDGNLNSTLQGPQAAQQDPHHPTSPRPADGPSSRASMCKPHAAVPCP
jgi:hypothetical protein